MRDHKSYKHPFRKLTDDQVRAARQMVDTPRRLAKAWNVHWTTVERARDYLNYKDVED